MHSPTISLSSEQSAAIALCCDLDTRIASITGGAGTGKTVVLGHAYHELCTEHGADRVVLCAPTGRAAKRIEELTAIKASTIHRLLEFPQPHEEGDPTEPRRNNRNPLSQRIVIVDEASMLSPTLYSQLLAALPNHALLRLFGDNNQLPPVESGPAPFVELLRSQPSITLTYNYRSDDEVISNAQRILRGSIPLRNSRFEIIYTDQPLAQMREFVDTTFAQASHQIITPTRKGNFGTLRINPSLQAKFNPSGPILLLDRLREEDAKLTVRASDKFLWVKNDYNLLLFNGETGSIEALDQEDGTLSLLTADDRAIQVPAFLRTYSRYHGAFIQYDPRKQLELGYAITTHKSQGSEFDTVVYVMCKAHAWMLNRRNFYTAITRARKQVIVICDRRAMSYAVRAYKG